MVSSSNADALGQCPECGEALSDGVCCGPRGCGWSPGEPRLTGAEVCQIIYEISEGTAKPEDVKHLQLHFCDIVGRGEQPPFEILQYLSRALLAHHQDGKRLETAFGLNRPKGRPKASEDERQQIACDVLHHRLAGKTYEETYLEICSHEEDEIGYERTVVTEAWAKYKLDAYNILRVKRMVRREGFSKEELARLDKIFSGVEGYVAPGNRLTALGARKTTRRDDGHG